MARLDIAAAAPLLINRMTNLVIWKRSSSRNEKIVSDVMEAITQRRVC